MNLGEVVNLSKPLFSHLLNRVSNRVVHFIQQIFEYLCQIVLELLEIQQIRKQTKKRRTDN